MMIDCCRACKSQDLHEIFSLPDIPLAGDFKLNEEDYDIRIPLLLLFCSNCKVIQIDQSVDLDRLFNTYAFSSSTIPSLVKHFDSYAEWIFRSFKPTSLLEVGCNDGILLEPLKKKGVNVFGVDMSSNIGDIARSKGLDVKTIKFGFNEIEILSKWIGQIDVVTASNAFPHNDDPNGFLQTAKALLSENGVLILEVMYAGSLKNDLQWDTVYHEHLHIHSLESLRNLLEINGFSLITAEIVDMHAGSLRVVAMPGNHQINSSASQILKNEEDSKLNTLESWLKFEIDSYESISLCAKKLFEISKNATIWAYGASGRASMWLNAANLNFIEKVVDASPLRAGRYIPGVSIPIVSPVEFNLSQPDYALITAWNYADIIIDQHPDFTGKWIIPLPKFKII
jgi:methylation protein EvaC